MTASVHVRARRPVARPWLLFAIIALACTQGVAKLTAQAAPAPAPTLPEYVLQIGDTLDIKFFYNAELNETVPIRRDGRISLQLVGDVEASGRTTKQLQAALKLAYTATLMQPEVAVIVKQFASQRIYVGGEVNIPGLIELRTTLTALQGIFQAGGVRRSGKLDGVVVLRYQGTATPQFIKVDLGPALSKGDRSVDLALEANDIVWVPKTKIAKMDDFIDQYARQLTPIPVALGINYLFGPASAVIVP